MRSVPSITAVFLTAALLPLVAAGQLGPGLTTGLELVHDGQTRSYDVLLPPGYAEGTAVPVVLDLHGFTSSPAEQRSLSGLAGLAESEGFAVVWPEGLGAAWNSSEQAPGSADDVGFLSALLPELAGQFTLDARRVYVSGLSNGGEMAYRLACEEPARFAAYVSVAAPFSSDQAQACAPGAPAPVLIFRGVSDQLVPFEGGFGGFAGLSLQTRSAAQTLAFWAEANACAAGEPDQSEAIGAESVCETFTGCEGGAQAGLCAVRALDEGGFAPGHIIYENTDRVDIARRGWNFMRQFQSAGEIDDDGGSFAINAGLTGAWFNPATAGQGLLVEPIPGNAGFFAAWFTFDEAAAKLGVPEQAWFTLQGSFDGDTADLEIFANSGGAFDAPDPVTSEAVGSATIVFEDCTSARFDYAFDEGPAGGMPLVRLTPDTLCQARAR